VLILVLIVFVQVERAGLKIISNVSHLSKNKNASVKPHHEESATEIHIRTHDMTENALIIPTTSKAREMMRVNSLPSNLSNYTPNSPHTHDFAAKMTPAQLGAKALSPLPSTSGVRDGVTVVASGSKVDLDDRSPVETARLLMTPRATDDRSVGDVSVDTVDPNMPLSPPREDPSLKQRRMSLLMNSEYVTEELSKNPGSFEVLYENGRRASKGDEAKPQDPPGAGTQNELAPPGQTQWTIGESSK
jgi:hypothetical protein